MIKVSVVVPTYKTPPEGLARLIGSLDRQTLPASEFEVIFVDDGSPDDTLERLEELATTRPHVRVEPIENSGWPSKPRNVGIDLAQGEYVAFMDHDDELYPDALRAAYEFGAANGADVVSGKESRTTEPAWGLGNYDEDRGQARGREDIHPLLPMNPHKMYRKAFLDAHGIRFIEQRRVLWEDIFFNLLVARHAEVVSSLASVPYYHWVTTEGSGSTTFVKSTDEYWDWLRKVCEATRTDLAGPENDLQRQQVELHQYGGRVLGVYDKKYATRSEANRLRIFERSRALQAEFDYARLEPLLPAFRRVRAELLRAGRRDLLTEICVSDAAIPGWGRARSMRWQDGKLAVDIDVEWGDSDGRRLRLTRRGDRIHKALNPAVRAVVSESATDVTEALSHVELGLFIHGRRSRVAWTLPAEGSSQLHEDEWGGVDVTGRVSALIDVSSAAGGRELDPGTHWDIFVRTRLDGTGSARHLRSDVPASVTAFDGGVHLVYPNDGGHATVIPQGQTEAIRRLSPLTVEAAGMDLVVEMSGDHDGRGRAFGRIGVAPHPVDDGWPGAADASTDPVPDPFVEREAVLEVSDGVARVRLSGIEGGSVALRIGDRVKGGPLYWILRRTEDGVTLQEGPRPAPPAPPAAKPASPAPAPAAPPTLRRKVGKVLRKLGLR